MDSSGRDGGDLDRLSPIFKRHPFPFRGGSYDFAYKFTPFPHFLNDVTAKRLPAAIP